MTAFLTRSNKRELLGWGLAWLLGLGIFIGLYEQAFPEASVNVQVNRAEALALGRAFLEEQGFDVTGRRSAIVFMSRGTTKQFLEKELGLRESDRLMSESINVWNWQARWFLPGEEEEFYVWVAPDGRTSGFAHVVAEEAEAETISSEEAEALGLEYLEDHGTYAADAYELQESREIEQPNRVDRELQWEHREFDIAGAKLRFSVGIQGDSVGSFTEYLHVPEAWIEKEVIKNQHRQFYGRGASYGHQALSVAAFVVFLFFMRGWQLRLRFAALLCLLFAVVTVLAWANGLGLSWMAYDTNVTVAAFFGSQLLGLGFSLLDGMFVVLIVGCAGEALARKLFPSQPPISRMMGGHFWTSKPIFMATTIGCSMAFLHAAYVTVFYVAGREVGVWSPMNAPYINSLGTPMPWLYPLTSGFIAALREELTYRLFAVSLLLRYTGRRWLAIGVPAIVWGFMHSSYPQDPAFIRGLELSLVGILFGVVFLRYGILASFVSHFAYNALLSSMVMLRSDDLYYTISGLTVVSLMFVPAMPGAMRLVRGQALSKWSEEVEEDQIREPRGPVREPRFHYIPFVPLPFSRYAWLLVFSLAIMVAGSEFLFSDDESFGDYVDVQVGRLEAQDVATRHLEEMGVSLEGYRPVTFFYMGLDEDELDYLAEEIGLEELNDFCETYLSGDVVWITRYFKPLEKKRYVVRILPSGDVYSWRTVLRETTAGARLSQEEARAKAEAFLQDEIRFSSEDYRLVDSSAEEMEGRTDHFFVWELSDGSIGDGYVRILVPVLGDTITEYTSFVDVPDDWTREREAITGWDMLLIAAALGVSLVVIVFVGGIFTMLFMRHELNWRIGLAAGLFSAACDAILSINAAPTFWLGYNPIKEPNVYRMEQIMEAGLTSVGAFVLAFLAAPLVEGYFRLTSPSSRPPMEWFGQRIGRFFGKTETEYNPLPLRRVWGEALLAGGILTIGLLVILVFTFPSDGGSVPPLFQIASGVSEHSSSAPEPSIPSTYTCAFPLIENLMAVLRVVGGAWLLAGAAVSIYRRFIRTVPRAAAMALSLSTLSALYEVDSLGDFLFNFGYNVAMCCLFAVPVGLMYIVCRRNQATCLATFFMIGLFAMGGVLTEAVTLTLVITGWSIIGVWFGLMLLGVYLIRISSRVNPLTL